MHIFSSPTVKQNHQFLVAGNRSRILPCDSNLITRLPKCKIIPRTLHKEATTCLMFVPFPTIDEINESFTTAETDISSCKRASGSFEIIITEITLMTAPCSRYRDKISFIRTSQTTANRWKLGSSNGLVDGIRSCGVR